MRYTQKSTWEQILFPQYIMHHMKVSKNAERNTECMNAMISVFNDYLLFFPYEKRGIGLTLYDGTTSSMGLNL